MAPGGKLFSKDAKGQMVGPLRQRLLRKGRHYKRTVQILDALVRYGFTTNLQDTAFILQHLHSDPTAWEELRALSRAQRLRKLFEELGPTFIKLGQLMATRPDLVPPEVVAELGRLRDQAPPEPFATIRQTIEAELGKPLGELFTSFSEESLATASIGQVHRATLEDGTTVAVKVQRPGVLELIEADMEILEDIALLVDRNLPEEDQFDLLGLATEFRRMLLREVDYTIEGRNIARFHANFVDVEGIVVPAVHWTHCSRRVLTMDFIDGVPLNEVRKVRSRVGDPKALTMRIGQAYIKQVFVDGFFHADPHQGNLFVLKDGRLSFLDFGAVGYLDSDTRDQISAFYLALLNRDVRKAARALADLAEASHVDFGKLEMDLQDFLDYTLLRSSGVSLAEGMNQRIIDVAVANEVTLPATMVLLERALFQMDGVCRTLDPTFDLVEVARSSLGTIVVGRLKDRPQGLDRIETAIAYRRLLRDLPRKADRILEKMQQDAFTIRLDTSFLDDLLAQAWRMVLILSVSLAMLALLTFYAITGTRLQLPRLGLDVGVAAIVGIWAVIVGLLYLRGARGVRRSP